MSNAKKKKVDILHRTYLQALNKKRVCLIANCSEHSINSHSVSKSVLKKINAGNHFYELGLHPWTKTLIQFSKIGVNEATGFPGLCAFHDNDLFKEIENHSIDFNDYQHLMLLNYKAILREQRIKEIRIDHYKCMLAHPESHLINEKYARDNIVYSKYNLADYDYFRRNIENELNLEKRNELFDFEIIEYPYFEIASCSIFTNETSGSITRNRMNYMGDYRVFYPLRNIFVHIIPQSEKSILILSYLKADKFFHESLIDKFKNQSLSELSDLLLCKIENWVCSESFYEKYIKKNEEKIANDFKENSVKSAIEKDPTINIFDGN